MPIADPAKSAPQAKPRKKKPKDIAVINDACTGCAGSPVCIELCPVDQCMLLVKDDVYAPDFGRVIVDPLQCIGCKRCTSKGPMDMYLDGCPWDAIDMVETPDFEERFGELPY
ncbi:MAG: 4Fe-4S ferredoxin [Phycisphaerales bacterium]|nr:4Fe-4S ferredoxin [Phycisphaerales bacterium]